MCMAIAIVTVFNIAIENGPVEIGDVPPYKNGDGDPVRELLVVTISGISSMNRSE